MKETQSVNCLSLNTKENDDSGVTVDSINRSCDKELYNKLDNGRVFIDTYQSFTSVDANKAKTERANADLINATYAKLAPLSQVKTANRAKE